MVSLTGTKGHPGVHQGDLSSCTYAFRVSYIFFITNKICPKNEVDVKNFVLDLVCFDEMGHFNCR